MHIFSTTTISASQPESKRAHNRCSKLWRCGFALLVLWAVSGCSATRVQDTSAPGNGTSPSHTSAQGESAQPLDSTTPEPDKITPTQEQADLQDEEQREIKDPDSMSGVDDSAAAGVTDKDAPSSSADQTSTPSQTQEVTISTPAQATSAQPAQPPALISHYTVKGGENLYTIASQPFIYADGMLWPLIYRANRDQIKNPRQIYPGQVLNIPRNISEPDKEQARTKAKESPIFAPTGQHDQSPAADK